MPSSQSNKLLKWSLIIAISGTIALGIALLFAQQADRRFDLALEKSPLEQLQKLSQSNEHNRDHLIFYWLGIRLGEAGQDPAALSALTQAALLNPNFAKSRYALGVILERTNHPQEAEGQLKRAIELEPNRSDPYFLLGKLYGKYGKFRESELCLRKANSLNPNDIESRFLLSVILLELAARTNEPFREEARDILLKLERQAPEDTRILSLLASSQVYFSQIKEAEALYRRILKINPNDLKSKALLGRSIAEQATDTKAFDEAEQLLLVCASKDSKNPAIPLAQGILFLRRTQAAKAIPYFQLAITRKTQEPEVWFHLGRAFMQVGKTAEAQQATTTFTRRDKNRREVRSLQLRLGFEAGESQEEIKKADGMRLQIARILMEDGNYRGARKHLETILQHNPTHAEAMQSLQTCLSASATQKNNATPKTN